MNEFKVGVRVQTRVWVYPTGVYKGVVRVIQNSNPELNPLGVHLDGEFFDDGSPCLTYFKPSELEQV